ncbi:(d)CMP kinase [Corynebacterium sp. P3-F1]|uniref:(d)CMP kinase n=1 Tax=Corynebacterium sp. P3-F1 TaxID=3059080 RepID=UPI00265D00E4|nr:(d)CMP kinase [Corynebacterium sp. P3-F1]WKK61503.1 (d)CMP kinase [Corynebacterium sp. P3-F1]
MRTDDTNTPDTPGSQDAPENLSNMPDGGLILAVDGPSGTGKSTTCRALAKQLNAKYVDTGAMYRVATLAVLRAGIDPQDTDAVIAATSDLPLEISDDPDSSEVMLAGENVAGEIRGREVTQNVSAVSAIPEVRINLVELQRKLARDAHRAIVEGRDIGTVVLVDAPAKAFLTASPEVRATRRYNQDIAAGRDADYDTVLADVIRRDELDSSRATSPLRPADDAELIDTSEMDKDAVLDALISLIERSAR